MSKWWLAVLVVMGILLAFGLSVEAVALANSAYAALFGSDPKAYAAGAAVGQVFLALALIVVTAWYVWLTNRISQASTDSAKASERLADLTSEYAEETHRLADLTAQSVDAAKNQLKQVERARLTTLRPFVHVTDLHTGQIQHGASVERLSGDRSLVGLQFQGSLVNVGAGPALDIRAHVVHPTLGFENANQVYESVLMSGEPTRREVWFPKVDTSSPLPRGGQMPSQIGLRLEYRDLFGRWWKTTVKIDLQVTVHNENEFTVQNVRLQRETERATLIDQPYITDYAVSTLIQENLDYGELPE